MYGCRKGGCQYPSGSYHEPLYPGSIRQPYREAFSSGYIDLPSAGRASGHNMKKLQL